MVWKASDGPAPLARALKGSGAMLLLPPAKKKQVSDFSILSAIYRIPETCVVKVWYKIWSLSYFSARNPKIKVHDWKGKKYQKQLFFVSLHNSLIKQRSLKESPWMSFYKGLAHLVYLESLRVMHSNNSEIWKALFTLRWSDAHLDPFHERKGPLSFRTTDW